MMDSSDKNKPAGRAMQRFFNDPDDIVDETVAGFIKAHRDLVRRDPMNARVVRVVKRHTLLNAVLDRIALEQAVGAVR